MLIPDRDSCVTVDLLARNARLQPDHVVLKFDSGEQYTNAELQQKVRSLAAGLQALGVKQGDYVLTWLPNDSRAVTLMLALNLTGAIYVPLNTAYKGGVLAHVIASSGAELMIADSSLTERLRAIDTAGLKRVVTIGDEADLPSNLQQLPESVLLGGEAGDYRAPEILPWHTQMVIFTSGTTGPSKGVLCSYMHTYVAALEFRHIGPSDCSLVALPMFHIGGVLGITFALIHGGSAALVQRFSTSQFWSTVRKLECTTVGLLGTMVQFLMSQPVQEGERDHPIKSAIIAPLGDQALAFSERFGIEIYSLFNMTELSVPMFCGPNPPARSTCGRQRAGVSLKLVDANGDEVAPGETGELIVRTDNPWAMAHGYLNDLESTARTWRNGWFHTGDLFYKDAEEYYYFVDRTKDMIRRRGENISSFEVEAEIAAHPAVLEVAAVAVPGDGGDDEVLAVISLREGESIEPAQLIEFLEPRLAYFMIPRYLRIMDRLPLTPSQKTEKHRLRSDGITPDTWDREAAGIRLKRESFGR